MAEDGRTIRSVDWRGVFPFLHLFRAFRIAMHPNKLALAMVLLLLAYGLGRGMDWIWPSSWCHEAQPVEMMQLPQYYKLSIAGERSGPFDVMLKWQLAQLEYVTQSVLGLDVHGVIRGVYNFALAGPGWAFAYHPIYGVVFGAVVLVMWSLFGGAIARVAAVHVTRDEKMSMRSALRFSTGKLLSFFFAPVLVGLFIGGLGTVIALVNLAFYVPYLGPVAVGAAFILTLAAGFVMTLALFGALGGWGLMYPTIAVEASDAFDAISRSFSYVFARPWRLLFYSAVALVYGVLTYAFLKLFIVVMLLVVRSFMVWFLGSDARQSFDAFFPVPNPAYLSTNIDLDAVHGGPGMKLGAVLFGTWYYLLVGLLGAYAVSFYFSASTIIYCLLRHDVDATELEDVYLEEGDDDDDLADLAADDGLGGATLPTATAATAAPGSPNTSPSPTPTTDAANPETLALPPATVSTDPPATFASSPNVH